MSTLALLLMFYSLFHFYAKASYSVCPSNTLQNTKAESLKTVRITIKIDQPGPHNPTPEIMFSVSFLLKSEDAILDVFTKP